VNKARLRCLWIGIAAVGLLGLFPPWVQTVPDARLTNPVGHAFIFDPPNLGLAVEINVKRLLIEWLAVVLVTGLLVWRLGGRRRP
jgi:hypothetical protein